MNSKKSKINYIYNFTELYITKTKKGYITISIDSNLNVMLIQILDSKGKILNDNLFTVDKSFIQSFMEIYSE